MGQFRRRQVPSMSFELQEETIATILRQARARAPVIALPTLGGEEREVSVAEMAALFYSRYDAETLREAAIGYRRRSVVDLETFSPLYLTNTCDSECKMCGMRRDNRDLERQTASPADVQRQLEINNAPPSVADRRFS